MNLAWVYTNSIVKCNFLNENGVHQGLNNAAWAFSDLLNFPAPLGQVSPLTACKVP